jgi:two-component system response regulator FixJ
VDDDQAVRDSLGLSLMTRGHAVQTHASARCFLDAIDELEVGCVVTDVRMPDMTGVEMLAELRDRRIKLPVIVITAYADVPLAIRAMRLGAIDLIEKPIDDDLFLESVRRAVSTHSNGKAPTAESQRILEKIDTLSARERDVLNGLLEGKANKMIAYDLGISIRTVEVHRGNLMSKMETKSLADLVRMSLIAFGE